MMTCIGKCTPTVWLGALVEETSVARRRPGNIVGVVDTRTVAAYVAG